MYQIAILYFDTLFAQNWCIKWTFYDLIHLATPRAPRLNYRPQRKQDISQFKHITSPAHHMSDISRVRHNTYQAYHMSGISQVKHITCQAYHRSGISQVRHITYQAHHRQAYKKVWHITDHDIKTAYIKSPAAQYPRDFMLYGIPLCVTLGSSDFRIHGSDFKRS